MTVKIVWRGNCKCVVRYPKITAFPTARVSPKESSHTKLVFHRLFPFALHPSPNTLKTTRSTMNSCGGHPPGGVMRSSYSTMVHLLSAEIQSVRPHYASTSPSIDPLDPDFLHKVMCEAGSVAEEACRELNLLAPLRIQLPINDVPRRSDGRAATEPADSLSQDDPSRGTEEELQRCRPVSTNARTRDHEAQTKAQESVVNSENTSRNH